MTEFAEQRLDLHYVVMESAPGDWRYTGDDRMEEFVYDGSIHCKVVEAIVAARLTEVDEGECILCTNPIGYVLYDDDDNPSGNGVRWHWTTAVWYGQHTDVIFLCEECSPHSIRDLFEERAQKQIDAHLHMVRAAHGDTSKGKD